MGGTKCHNSCHSFQHFTSNSNHITSIYIFFSYGTLGVKSPLNPPLQSHLHYTRITNSLEKCLRRISRKRSKGKNIAFKELQLTSFFSNTYAFCATAGTHILYLVSINIKDFMYARLPNLKWKGYQFSRFSFPNNTYIKAPLLQKSI